MARDAVLVIDDDPDFTELAQITITPLGVSVFVAANCASGLDLLRRERNRLLLVLLDHFMPGMDPRRCTAAVRELAGVEVPIVLCTAAARPAALAAELGLSRWLSKPFDLDQLKSMVRDAKGGAPYA